jgi:hypothetical protein
MSTPSAPAPKKRGSTLDDEMKELKRLWNNKIDHDNLVQGNPGTLGQVVHERGPYGAPRFNELDVGRKINPVEVHAKWGHGCVVKKLVSES